MPHSTHGIVLLIGSGEMASSMVEVHKYAMSLIRQPVRAVFVDTPAGFQLNADLLAQKAVEFFEQHLNTPLAVCSFKNAMSATPEQVQAAVRCLHRANYVFAGPGSPTYAVRNWRNTPVLDAMFKVLAHGGCLTFASAAALTLGRFTIPVYEVYKVGEAVSWVEGLNLLGHNDLDVAVVPHWNNTSGGDHDTRFCFMGEPRWQSLESMLPSTTAVLGIDEHTACLLRLDANVCEVYGIGQVTVRRNGTDEQIFTSGASFSLDLLRSSASVTASSAGEHPLPEAPTWEAIRARHEAILASPHPSHGMMMAYIYELLDLLSAARQQHEQRTRQQAEEALREALVHMFAVWDSAPLDADQSIAPCVEILLQVRADLRAARLWKYADQIRDYLLQIGIVVQDTPSGPVWQRSSD